MSIAPLFALALAAAIVDATVGYPAALARAIGSPSKWAAQWLAVVEGATNRQGGARTLAIYLAPVVVAAAAIAAVLSSGPIGFVVSALIVSTLSGRQSIDARARAVARAWETDGPYEALTVAEDLQPNESEPRLARASAAAIAARFADEVAAPTLFIVLAGLAGAAFCRALSVAGSMSRDRRDDRAFGRAVAVVETWALTPAARLGALWIAAAATMTRSAGASAAWSAVVEPAPTPTRPAEAAMLAALGDPPRDDPAYVRRALGLFRRAAALEFAALAILALASAAWR